MLFFDSQHTSVSYKSVVWSADMSLQSFENSLVFNALFFSKLFILMAIFNANCWSERRV